jgi:hypothetical protein
MPKGRTYLGGALYLAKRKAFEKGENLSNLEMLLKICFLYLRPNANEFEKMLSKDWQNQAKWCKCGPKV